MDFGDILNMWDAQTRPAKAKNIKAGGEKGKAAESQEAWLKRYGVPGPTVARSDETVERRLSRRDIDAMPIDASIDLHGMTVREAEAALASFFAAAERAGCEKILIVHGKGLHSSSEPVLAGLVRRWLETRTSAGRSGHPDAANGGNGATWVLLKRTSDQRSR
ncbi:MAG: DNA mismatch repair protein MutS [Spirochaetae bacterium HGW-Spirochaetae-3]|nr:MAG: DNA mismatch repair protein MutS [Spirochaetae bacterium HGW-Spirochaetae-3]